MTIKRFNIDEYLEKLEEYLRYQYLENKNMSSWLPERLHDLIYRYEDDLYLDLIITKDGKKIIADEDELLEARKKGEITQSDVESAYNTLKYLEEKYVNNFSELIKLTDYLNERFKNKIKK